MKQQCARNKCDQTSLTPLISQSVLVLELFHILLFLSPHTEIKWLMNSVGFSSSVSTVTAFHGSGVLATFHLSFIENLTNETRLLPSSSVIIWFKQIKGLRKVKPRFWGKPPGWKTGLAQGSFPKCCALWQGSFQ